MITVLQGFSPSTGEPETPAATGTASQGLPTCALACALAGTSTLPAGLAARCPRALRSSGPPGLGLYAKGPRAMPHPRPKGDTSALSVRSARAPRRRGGASPFASARTYAGQIGGREIPEEKETPATAGMQNGNRPKQRGTQARRVVSWNPVPSFQGFPLMPGFPFAPPAARWVRQIVPAANTRSMALFTQPTSVPEA